MRRTRSSSAGTVGGPWNDLEGGAPAAPVVPADRRRAVALEELLDVAEDLLALGVLRGGIQEEDEIVDRCFGWHGRSARLGGARR
jgi:hypothetical protein